MRFKHSLAYPIIFIISLVAGVTLWLGYYSNLDTLQDTIEGREIDKSQAVYRAVKDKIDHEIKKIDVLSQILKEKCQLQIGLIGYQVHGDLEPLQEAMDRLYPSLRENSVDFFLITDQQGNIVYRASTRSTGGDLSGAWGLEEALTGRNTISAGLGPLGWAILSLAPISFEGRQYGVLVLGISLDDDFARKIGEATNNQISFSTSYQVLASSWPAGERWRLDLDRVTESIINKKFIFLNDDRLNLDSFYTPIKIADETICLIINADTTPIADLLGRKKKQLFLSLLAVLAVTIGIGSGLTIAIVRPLKELENLSLAAIKELAYQDVAFSRWGNEIDTLSWAVELMLSAIKSHLQDLHRIQETLRREKSFLLFLDNVFSSIQDGLCVLDLNDTILRVNRVYEERFGNVPLVGEKCYRAIYGLNEPCPDCPCHQAIETGKVAYQSRLVSRGETEFWIELYAFPLRDQETGAVTGVIEYSRDITEIKATENALRQRDEQLRQASKMEAVGRLAGGVAHDFNNILTVILGECELLRQQLPEKDPMVEEVRGIMEAARRAASLTQHLLAFSRKQVLRPQPIDINTVVGDMDRMLRRVLGEDIDLVTILRPGLSTVEVDPNQLEQVILNLAANARDAMPRGGSLTIETANVDLDEDYIQQHVDTLPGPHVMLAISDTGVGLDEEAKSHMFEPFFTTKEVGRGTGLGLSMVYGIIKQSRGHIWVYSEPGQGTTFRIYFPRVDRPPQGLTEPPALREMAPGGTETILLVEDEEEVRKVVCRMLEKAGYRILAAADPKEALRLSRDYQAPIHLLFTDVVMPGMSGRELANRILAQRPQAKILFTSGYTENAILHHGVLDQGISFINKPFKYNILVKKVREVLDA